MKTITVIYEGAADVPMRQLEGRTPLQVARCTHANRLAEQGRCGLMAPVKDGLDARNEILLAALLGVDVEQALTLHRGPLEALAVNPDLGDYLYRGNLVSVDGGVLRESRVSHLSIEETGSLCASLQESWSPDELQLVVSGPAALAVSTRDEALRRTEGFPPAFMEGERLDDFLPKGRDSDAFRRVVERSREVLVEHAINEVRLDLGENPATALWLWGGGPALKPGALELPAAARATILTQSVLATGLGQACGMEVLPLSTPEGDGSPAAAFKVAAVVDALRERDNLLVYAAAPLELGRYGSATDKVRALERLDHYLLGPLLDLLEAFRPYRILLVSDGVVSTEARHPTSGSVPMVIAGDGIRVDEAPRWDEEACALGSLGTVRPPEARTLL